MARSREQGGQQPSPDQPRKAGHPLMTRFPERPHLSVKVRGEDLGGLASDISSKLAKAMRERGLQVQLTRRELRDANSQPYLEVEIHHSDRAGVVPERFRTAAQGVAARLTGLHKPSDELVQAIINQVLRIGK